MTEEEIAAIAAKAMGQAMSIVRYADDFVILAKNWVGGFLRKVESILEERMGLTVNREKTKLLNLDADSNLEGRIILYLFYCICLTVARQLLVLSWDSRLRRTGKQQCAKAGIKMPREWRRCRYDSRGVGGAELMNLLK